MVDREDCNLAEEWGLMKFYSANFRAILGDEAPTQEMKEDAMMKRGKERVVDSMVPFGHRGKRCL